MSTLTYLRNKAAVSVIRSLQPRPQSNPDEILYLPSRDPERTIKAHVYRSKDSTRNNAPAPVLLNFHGSGFVLPLHGSDDHFCRLVADSTAYTVLDVQYRLGPEHPFPAAPNDTADAITYVLTRPQEYDTAHISLSGFSAGANLALGAATASNIPDSATFRALLAFYPPTDLSIDPYAKTAPDPHGKPIPGFVAAIFDSAYIGSHDPRDPLVSPAFADAAKLPLNVLVITCACDSLAMETERLAEKIAADESGGERHLVTRRVEGVSHAWDKAVKEGTDGARKRDEVYAMAVEMLKR